MARYEKWLKFAAADTPADEVARGALTERLLAVSFFLKKSVGSADETEAIHQLRVWTRRAATALDLFAAGLPQRRCERMQKTLHKLRHVAGEVRDCDVQRERLENAKQDVPGSALRSLQKDRRHAGKRLKKLRRRLRRKDRLKLQIEELLEKVAWPKRHSKRLTPPFGALCNRYLAVLADAFFTRSKVSLRNFDNLHQLRIAGKQLRYALELATPIVPARALRKLYDALDEAQDRIGVVCDEKALIDSARKWLAEATKAKQRQRLEKLLKAQERQYDLAHQKLLRWWSAALMRRFRSLWKAVAK